MTDVGDSDHVPIQRRL